MQHKVRAKMENNCANLRTTKNILKKFGTINNLSISDSFLVEWIDKIRNIAQVVFSVTRN